VPQQEPAAPSAVASRAASTPMAQVQQPATQAPASQPAKTTSSAVKLANVTALYSDKLTGAEHEH
jgi:hypothetical protein